LNVPDLIYKMNN